MGQLARFPGCGQSPGPQPSLGRPSTRQSRPGQSLGVELAGDSLGSGNGWLPFPLLPGAGPPSPPALGLAHCPRPQQDCGQHGPTCAERAAQLGLSGPSLGPGLAPGERWPFRPLGTAEPVRGLA